MGKERTGSDNKPSSSGSALDKTKSDLLVRVGGIVHLRLPRGPFRWVHVNVKRSQTLQNLKLCRIVTLLCGFVLGTRAAIHLFQGIDENPVHPLLVLAEFVNVVHPLVGPGNPADDSRRGR